VCFDKENNDERGETMAGTVNKVILIGRLGADPDVRYTPEGSPVVNFRMATNEPVRGADGSWEERPEWHRIVVFGKLAENCGTYLNKGKLVYVEGKLKTRQWDDAQGVKHYTTEVVAREVHFLGSAGEQSSLQTHGSQSASRTTAAPGYGSRPLTEELPPVPSAPDEDIPF
jgi:single-strand DNA-binding protein